METRTDRFVQNHPPTPAVIAPTPVPPPSTRRPRVREVSSRFMSPVSSSSSSSSSSGDSPRHLHQKSRRQLKLPDGGENRSSETARSLDSPFPQNQKQNRSKPLKENGHRLDTPTTTMMLPPPSRSRLNQQRLLNSSAAARLLRLSVSTDGEEDDKSNGSKLFNTPASSPLRRSLSSSCDDVRASLSVKGSSLPPVAPNSKSQADTKRQKRVLGQQAGAHCLKLLHNRYLQWRFANASAQVKAQAQKAQAEKMFYSIGLKMSEISVSVQKKRIELQRLLRVKALKEIVESQIPYLEQWTTLIEEEYLTSVSETSEALLNASLRLPLDTDIKVDYKELAETLDVASKSMEGIVQNIVNFVPKTQEMETLMSELARVSSSEKASVEDCGVSLLKTHSSHIEECYLRSQLIQHHHQECELQHSKYVV
ncbi:unnamed protein product [Eruca vesicaria subsp. sativa]|uniref:Protein ENDOSPERM DEFECTIVE 1 n=1 Tax=Eruca vesicaria subsp. sativa TaxID=29727 RepID=A0ABC8LJM3_ERUVS|nr:unnamed protein product [Eruca vesicaria subsp. sativa]